jgi:putative membrane protein
VNGINGFLGTRASLMLDVVFLAMFAIVPLLSLSLYCVKRRLRYGLHKRLQLGMAAILLVAVSLFELDMRLFTDWRARAAGSPYYSADGWSLVWASLTVHLGFAVPTLVLWIAVIALAWRRFPTPPRPASHSETHRVLGWLAAIGMTMTAATGWLFYWLAFAA